jgi:molybdate transport system substrate-binding protein
VSLRRTALALLLVFTLVGAACGDDDDGGASDTTKSTTTAAPADTLEGDIQVAAAASLTEAFDELAQMFEDDHPGVTVTTEFGPSSGLSDGILEGQPADVFASADEANMQKLVDGDAVDESAVQVFVNNRPEIAVPAGNPGGVEGLDDFARDELLVGLCAEDVPCGKFARTVLSEAGVVPAIDTNEVDVKALLGKIEGDDLDLGMVYHTDVVAAGDEVEGIEIPEDQNVIAMYPIAPLAESDNAEVAQAFADFIASPEALKVLEKYGFLAPA